MSKPFSKPFWLALLYGFLVITAIDIIFRPWLRHLGGFNIILDFAIYMGIRYWLERRYEQRRT
jgi:hypothetical protein